MITCHWIFESPEDRAWLRQREREYHEEMQSLEEKFRQDLHKRLENKNKKVKTKLVVVSGPSASGKSTVCKAFKKDNPDWIIVPQDSFYKHDFILDPYADMDNTALDNPVSINWQRLIDFVNTNKDHNIIVEGNMVLESKPLLEMADKIIVLDPSYNYCYNRFMKRYPLTDPERNRAKSDYYIKHAWPTHVEYINNFRAKEIDHVRLGVEEFPSMGTYIKS